MPRSDIDLEIAEGVFAVLQNAVEDYMRRGLSEDAATDQAVSAMSDYVDAFRMAMTKRRLAKGKMGLNATDGSRLYVH